MEAMQQAESSECGLASLAMVANHYGQKLALRDLRQRFSLSLKGANLSRLMTVAGHEQGHFPRRCQMVKRATPLPESRIAEVYVPFRGRKVTMIHGDQENSLDP